MSLVRGYSNLRPGAPFDVVKLYGQVTFGAVGAVSADNVENGAWAVARSAAGRYTITTTEKYPELLSFSATIYNAGTDRDSQWQVRTEYVPSTGVLVVSHLTAGSEADPVSTTKTYFALEFKVSSL